MGDKHTEPGIPANKDRATKRVTYIGDYLASFSGHAARLKRRRMLTRTGKLVDADTLRRVSEISPKRGEDVRRALYLVTEGGMVAIPAPTPPLPNHKVAFARWVLARLREGSTYRGLFLVLGVLGWAVTPEQSEALMALGVAMAGVIGVAFPDKAGEA